MWVAIDFIGCDHRATDKGLVTKGAFVMFYFMLNLFRELITTYLKYFMTGYRSI
jgi:hypothetical protein